MQIGMPVFQVPVMFNTIKAPQNLSTPLPVSNDTFEIRFTGRREENRVAKKALRQKDPRLTGLGVLAEVEKQTKNPPLGTPERHAKTERIARRTERAGRRWGA